MPDYTVCIGMRCCLVRTICLLAPAFVLGQSRMDPRPGLESYKASARIGGHGLGAEFHARTVPAPEASFVVRDYLVVEVSLFPARAKEMAVNAGRFSLRINGAKTPVLAQLPGMVAASLRYPDYEGGPRMTAAGSLGNAGVILGRDTTPRWPDDPRARRLPRVETGPSGSANAERQETAPPWEFVTHLALEERTISAPAAGLLYFPYKGKLEKIRKLELLYAGPEGDAALALR